MTLQISISDATIATLSAKAQEAGVDIETYAVAVLEAALRPKSFEELSNAAAEAFERSGMSEAELETLIDAVKTEVRVERRSRRGA